MEDGEEMRGVVRALEVLRALNQKNGATIVQLNAATGISRPALYRIVRTLCSAGYLRSDSEGYRLTPLVQQLSDGFDDEAWVTEIASPILDELQRQVIWPTDLFTFHSDRMVMRRTTRRSSPWTIDRAMVGLRIPLLITAVGRAYLAFQPSAIQEGVLQRLAESEDSDDAPARERRLIEMLLQNVRAQGYATREHGFMRETGSLAVPVLVNGVAACSIAITYISSAMPTTVAIGRYRVPLQESAARIAACFNSAQS
jgi:IclR family mhp operon transcriptional activator